jgi:hypothetical protein
MLSLAAGTPVVGPGRPEDMASSSAAAPLAPCHDLATPDPWPPHPPAKPGCFAAQTCRLRRARGGAAQRPHIPPPRSRGGPLKPQPTAKQPGGRASAGEWTSPRPHPQGAWTAGTAGADLPTPSSAVDKPLNPKPSQTPPGRLKPASTPLRGAAARGWATRPRPAYYVE